MLVVGATESWGAGEILNALITMPREKIFFEKSPFTAYFNRIGLYMFGPVILLILAGLGIWLWIRRRNAEKEKGVKGLLHRIAKFLTKRWFRRE